MNDFPDFTPGINERYEQIAFPEKKDIKNEGRIPKLMELAWSACQKSPEELKISAPAALKIIRLDNGITIYFQQRKNHDSDVSLANFKLIVQTGFFAEDEEELGISHLVEHGVYEGTESYTKEDICAFLEEIHCKMAADANASTSSMITDYFFNKVPTTDKEKVKKCIKILSEFLSAPLFPEENLWKEKQEVVNELIFRSGYDQDFQKFVSITSSPTQQVKSRFHDKLGPKIANCESPQQLREIAMRFHQKWYKPHLASFVAIGDFGSAENVKDILNYIQEIFGCIPPSQDPSLQIVLEQVPKQVEAQYHKFENEQIPNPFILFYLRQKDEIAFMAKLFSEKKRIRQRMLLSFLNAIVERRYSAIINKPQTNHLVTPILNEMCPASADAEFASICCVPKQKKTAEAYEEFVLMLKDLSINGIDKEEFESAKKEVLLNIFNKIKNRHTEENLKLLNTISEDVTNGKGVILDRSMLNLYEIATVETIMPAEVEQLWNIFDKEIHQNLMTFFIAPPGHEEENILSEFKEIYNKVKDLTSLEVERPVFQSIDLPKGLPLAPIEAQREIESIGAHELYFENGIKVILKPIDSRKNSATLSFFLPTGARHIRENEVFDFENGFGIIQELGMQGKSHADFENFIKGTTIKRRLETHPFHSEMSIYLKDLKEMELALQLIHLSLSDFTNFESEFEEIFVETCKMYVPLLEQMEITEEYKLGLALDQMLWGKQKIFQSIINAEEMQSTNWKSSREIVLKILQNLQGASLVVAGKFDLEEIIPLIQAYIGNLASSQGLATQIIEREIIHMPAKPESIEIFEGHVPGRSEKMLMAPLTPPINEKDSFVFNFTYELVNNYLRDTMRIKIQKTYGLSSKVLYNPAELGIHYFQIDYNCQTEELEEIREEVIRQLGNLIETTDEDLTEKIEFMRQNKLKERKNSQKKTDYWNGRLCAYELKKWDIALLGYREAYYKEISLTDIRTKLLQLKEGLNLMKELTIHPKKLI